MVEASFDEWFDRAATANPDGSVTVDLVDKKWDVRSQT
jgi:hypothetical protein